MEPNQKRVVAFWVAILAIFFALSVWSLSEDNKSKCSYGSHQIRPGETLFGIALQFCDGNIGVAVLDIKEYNGINDPSNLRIGTIIVIPAS
jgi:LysM repeat protein